MDLTRSAAGAGPAGDVVTVEEVHPGVALVVMQDRANKNTFTDELVFGLGRAFRQVGVLPVERRRDDEAQHRVAEELQPLVRGQPAVLVRVRAVREGLFQPLGVKADPQRGLQVRQRRPTGHGFVRPRVKPR